MMLAVSCHRVTLPMKTKAAPDTEAIESVLYLTKQKSLEGHCNHHAVPALPVVAAAPRFSYPAP
jgi:hypothetical protein